MFSGERRSTSEVEVVLWYGVVLLQHRQVKDMLCVKHCTAVQKQSVICMASMEDPGNLCHGESQKLKKTKEAMEECRGLVAMRGRVQRKR